MVCQSAAGNMTKSAQPPQPLSQQQPYQQQSPVSQLGQAIQNGVTGLQQPNKNYPLSQSAYTDSIGTVPILGEVINESPVTARFVKIIVTFYLHHLLR
jgi:hypothetical protein